MIATLEVFRMRYQAFCERFGRDPEPDEPLFFDPAQEDPVAPDETVIRSQIIAAAAAARVEAGLVLDFVRVGRRPWGQQNSVSSLPWRGRAVVPEEPST